MVGVWMGLCPVLIPGQQRCTMRTTCLLFALLVLMILQCWLRLDCIDVCWRQAMCHLDLNLGKMICEQYHRPLNLFSAAYEAILGWLVCTVMLWRQVRCRWLEYWPSESKFGQICELNELFTASVDINLQAAVSQRKAAHLSIKHPFNRYLLTLMFYSFIRLFYSFVRCISQWMAADSAADLNLGFSAQLLSLILPAFCFTAILAIHYYLIFQVVWCINKNLGQPLCTSSEILHVMHLHSAQCRRHALVGLLS